VGSISHYLHESTRGPFTWIGCFLKHTHYHFHKVLPGNFILKRHSDLTTRREESREHHKNMGFEHLVFFPMAPPLIDGGGGGGVGVGRGSVSSIIFTLDQSDGSLMISKGPRKLQPNCICTKPFLPILNGKLIALFVGSRLFS
jgi:hypothetical protein